MGRCELSKKLALERYHWFHGQIKTNRYPNARRLAGHFEISTKQAQRDIEFLRERLSAPFVYCPEKRGYCYEDTGYELPPVWFKEDEFHAFCIALRLAATLPNESFKNSLNNFLDKFLSFRYMGALPRLSEIMEKVSVKNIQYYRVDEAIFHNIVDSLFRNDPVKISYHSPHKNETTDRIILPLHLLCYMGSWHIIAFCTLRNELRDFALSRIRSIETISDKITLPDNMPSIKEYMRQNFGLMSGEKSTEVCLKFTPDVSSWISEQIWHKKQAVSIDSNGNLFLRIPVADFREIRREILKFGASVEVLSPEELRNEIKKEIEKMSAVYR
jgi:predicted DNA-binding transcriptional regulator YafY